MDQFVVPQFIEVEDKIFGPITTRQFIILLVTALILFITFKLADTVLFIFLAAVIGGSSLVIAFVKINGQPFHYFLLNLVQTVRRPSRRIWYKDFTKAELTESIKSGKIEVVEAVKEVPKMSYSRIRDLSLIVNTGGYYSGSERE
ncbi:MAG: PrgI family protein [Candidatus Magasanikbacteria bacterium]|nr:PrgI family protein [Candidatus Magasanikbacteria bacterium]